MNQTGNTESLAATPNSMCEKETTGIRLSDSNPSMFPYSILP